MALPIFNTATIEELKAALPAHLPEYLLKHRWFGGKARELLFSEILDVIPVQTNQFAAAILYLRIQYAGSQEDFYALPLILSDQPPSSGDPADARLHVPLPQSARTLILRDALKDSDFQAFLLAAIHGQRTIKGMAGELLALQTNAFPVADTSIANLMSRPVKAEQSNTSIIYGDRLILKFFRRLEEGVNPDLEVGTFLTETARFKNIPQLFGAFEYRNSTGNRMTQAILQEYVANQGDAWQYTLRSLSDFYAEAAKRNDDEPDAAQLPEFAHAALTPYLNSAALLARRTAEMHLALASDSHTTGFAPEPFTESFQGRFTDSLLSLTTRVFQQLRGKMAGLPQSLRAKARSIAAKENSIKENFQSALSKPIQAARVRIHGDYHLGQVLYTGSDFMIVDFEGEPARPLAERRTKRSPLQDVAGMLRSFHYAAHAALLSPPAGLSEQDAIMLNRWAEPWNTWVSQRFLKQYWKSSGAAPYLPADQADTKNLLQLYLLEKAVYELGYELNNRPAWVGIPLEGISQVLEGLNNDIF